jgi:hypothetical protein
MRATHLVARFFESLRATPLDTAEVAWVTAALEPSELRVWNGMSNADRAEGVAVARRFDTAVAATPDAIDPTNASDATVTTWRAAALLHDAGKQLSGYGTIGRAAVTMIATVSGKGRVRGWARSDRPTFARMGRYVAHDELGAALLRDMGARGVVAAWAEAHHRPQRWAETGIPLAVCRALAAADGEPTQPD